jgi:ABC-type multidrug transport system permease subunit
VGFLWISALKDLRRRLNDRVALVMWLGIPLLIGGLMSLAMGGGSIRPRAKLLVADLDESFVSGALVSMAGSGGEEGVVEVTKLDLQAGRARMERGEASGLLVIPEGFGQALFEQTPTELQLVTNPAQRILPGILREGLAMLVEVVHYLQAILGSELTAISTPPADGSDFQADAFVAAQSVAINSKLRGLQGVLFPPVLEVETVIREEPDEEPAGGLGLLLFPGILFMSLLFIAQGMSDDLWTEADAGTLRRSLATPHGLAAVLFGKVLAGAVVMACVCALALALGAALFELRPAALVPALLWSSFSGAVLLPLFLLVQTLGQTKRSASILASVLVFPLMMLGGSFFPFEAMPSWMASIGSSTPNGLALVQFRELLAGESELSGLLRATGVLLLFATTCTSLTLYRARRRFQEA